MEAKYSAIVVFLCVVVPVMFGLFVWPASDETVTDWNVDPDNQINLTDSLKTTEVPNTSPYSGANNNLFLFDNDVQYVTDAVTRTDTATPFQSQTRIGGGAVVSGDMPAGVNTTTAAAVWTNFYNLLDAQHTADPSSAPDPELLNILLWTAPSSQNLVFTYEGEQYHNLIVFKNGRAQLYEQTTGALADVTDVDFQYDRTGFTITQYYGTPLYLGKYVDLKDGFHYDGTPSNIHHWINGYVNHTATLIIKPNTYFTQQLIDVGNETITIWPTSFFDGDWFVATDSDPQVHILGSVNTYDYLLILIDADREKITVYGLTGMNGFTDLYTDHLGNNVTFDYTGGPFTQIDFRSGDFDYYMAGTTIESGTVMAIKDAAVTPRNYYADNEWTFVLKNPAVIGTSLTFSQGTDTHVYPITGGKISLTFAGDTEPTEVLVRDMVIGHIPGSGGYETYINGKLLPYEIRTVTLGGVWDAGVYVCDVEWTSHKEYSWDTGVFGLDITSFCVVGLLTAVASFFFFAFVMNRMGGSDTLAMIVSIGCGAFYLALLMA